MVSFILRCLYYLQIHKLMRYLRRKKIVILTYHGFTDKRTHPGIENYKEINLHIEEFRSQLLYMKKHYHVISLDQLVEHYMNGTGIPDKSIVITIDDGYQSNYRLAYPIFKQLDIPATIFITTNFIEGKEFLWVDRLLYAIEKTTRNSLQIEIDGEVLSFDLHDDDAKMACETEIRAKLKAAPQGTIHEIIENIEQRLGQKLSMAQDIPEIYCPLEWHEITEMLESGLISIGSHTHNHVILSRCSTDHIEKELSLSKRLFEQRTGMPCELFSYPNGGPGDFDHRTKTYLRDLGYSCGLTSIRELNNGVSDRFELSRLDIANEDSTSFILSLSGISNLLISIKHAIPMPNRIISWFSL